MIFLKHICGPNPSKCSVFFQNLPSVQSRHHQGLKGFQLSPCAALCSVGWHGRFQGYYSRKETGTQGPPRATKHIPNIVKIALPSHSPRSWGNALLGLCTALRPSRLTGVFRIWRVNRWEGKELRAERAALMILPATKTPSVFLP